MSSRKKSTQQRKIDVQLKLRAKTRTRPATARSTEPSPLDGLLATTLAQLTERGAPPVNGANEPPPQAIEAYAEVLQWAASDPDGAADLACLHGSDWIGPMAGIAFPDYNLPVNEVRDTAWQFRAWHILNGLWYTLDWPGPVAAMSIDEIIAQLRADGAAGKVLRS